MPFEAGHHDCYASRAVHVRQFSKSTSLAGLDVFTDIVKHNNFIGFSFSDWIVDKKKNYMSGQWAMEGETKGFGSNWESN